MTSGVAKTKHYQIGRSIRKREDVLITLNTGAGKTIVGLLIAQSLVNEALDNVVYVCSTIDLVLQTAKEAKRIGLTIHFVSKEVFLTIYSKLVSHFALQPMLLCLNGYSVFRGRNFRERSYSMTRTLLRICCVVLLQSESVKWTIANCFLKLPNSFVLTFKNLEYPVNTMTRSTLLGNQRPLLRPTDFTKDARDYLRFFADTMSRITTI